MFVDIFVFPVPASHLGGDNFVFSLDLRPIPFISFSDGKSFLTTVPIFCWASGIFLSEILGDTRGDFGLAELGGVTWCLPGGWIDGTSTSVNVLLARLCREREGRRAEHGVGAVGVQDWCFGAKMEEGVWNDLKLGCLRSKDFFYFSVARMPRPSVKISSKIFLCDKSSIHPTEKLFLSRNISSHGLYCTFWDKQQKIFWLQNIENI